MTADQGSISYKEQSSTMEVRNAGKKAKCIVLPKCKKDIPISSAISDRPPGNFQLECWRTNILITIITFNSMVAVVVVYFQQQHTKSKYIIIKHNTI